MAKVAFLGLGRDGLSDGRAPQDQGRPRGHRLQPHRRQGREMGRSNSAARRAPTPKAAARGPGLRDGLRRQRQRSARGDARRQRRLRRHGQRRDLRRPHHRLGRDRARASRRGARKRGFDFIDAPVSGGQAGAENGVLTVMCGGDAGAFARAEQVIAAYARACNLLGAPGSGQLAKMVNQICIAGAGAGPGGRHSLRQEGRPRHREADRHDLQGRGAVLADGEPLQDHDGRQVRLRLRGRLDAQGPGICLAEARRNGAHLPVTALVDQFYAEVQKMGGKRWDTSSLMARLER